jgi:hypothetical protein
LRLFSNHVKTQGFIPNINQIAIVQVEGRQDVPPVITFTGHNQPRYKGMEIIYSTRFLATVPAVIFFSHDSFLPGHLFPNMAD